MIRPALHNELNTLVTSILHDIVARQVSDKRPVFAYLVCCETENPDAHPPQIGVIFREDLQDFLRQPNAYADGIESLLIPTLQEDYDFPTKTMHPYQEVAAAGIATPAEDESLAFAKQLTVTLNQQRPQSMSPFVLIDLEGEWRSFYPLLTDADQHRLTELIRPPSVDS